jgi:hypothetical protein
VEIAILTLLVLNTLAVAGFFVFKRKANIKTSRDKKDKDYETMKKWLVARGDPDDKL